MTTDRPERRARTVALAGLGLQILLALGFAFLMVWGKSEALRAVALFAGAGVPIWLVLLLVFHQKVLVQEEVFETEELRRDREGAKRTAAIFDVADEELLLAQRRLRWMYRWLLPIFAVIVIAILTAMALAGWTWSIFAGLGQHEWSEIEHTLILVSFVGGAAFISFLFSRYATGMAKYSEWRMLHAGAAWMMGVTLAALATAIMIGIIHFLDKDKPEHILAYVLRGLMLVLALEILLNFVLDFYRPRAAGEEPRPSFDSRLLGLFTEPGGIAKSIADAMNYQFGFEVSKTWFYKLLERSVVPLIGFALLTLVAASCMMFVEAEEAAVVERFGEKRRVVGSGFHWKLPWPIECAYKVRTRTVHEFHVGDLEEPDPSRTDEELILWTNKHSSEPHLEVLTAAPRLAPYLEGGRVDTVDPETARGTRVTVGEGLAVPVSQLRVALTIHYRILDPYQWLRTYSDPEGVLEAIAERSMTRYSAGVEVSDLLGGDRGRIESALEKSIKQEAQNRGLGIDIVFIGLQGVHPPAETAEAFQDVIGAESKRAASINAAEAERNRKLTEAAGSMKWAYELYDAIVDIDHLETSADVSQEKLDAARERVNRLFFGDPGGGIPPVGGVAAQLIADAQKERWRHENTAYARARMFGAEMATSSAAPDTYRMGRYLEMLADSTSGIRKYILATEDGTKLETLHINLQDPRDLPLDIPLKQNE